MKYVKKIAALILRGLKKLAYLVKERFDLIEVKVLTVGIALAFLALLFFAVLFFIDPHLNRVLVSAAFMNTMGGRSLGVATCLSAGLSPLFTIVFNLFIEIIAVMISYGFLVLIMRNVIEPKLFRNAVRQAEMSAQNQKTMIKKYGVVGLFLFVMFPFFMTGPVVGSIIGYLLNYRVINNFLIVFSGTLASIIIYTLAGNRFLFYINQYVNVDLMKKWGTITVSILIVFFLIYHLKTVKAFLDKEE
ncbi:MAG: hypothetical protein VR64_13890 [Desulfatitalea sp. BRH_c12]|nr:MAG: hypothetical protein VR64_13890 [Desulfatitalea sp. BRH_c12]